MVARALLDTITYNDVDIIQKKINKRERFLSVEEASLLLEKLKERSQQVYEIAFISLYTGMRLGTILNLQWHDIDFRTSTILMRDAKGGTGSIPIHTNVKELLFTHKNNENKQGYIFTNREGNKIKSLSKTYERVVDKLGFNEGITDCRMQVCFHTLRHTFASHLASNGIPLYSISKLLGHKDITTTQRYAKLSASAERDALEKLPSFDQ